MIRHHLLLIYRNVQRSRSYFLINLTGLTTGIACTLLIFLWVNDELNMNKFNTRDEQVYEVMEHQKYATELMTTTSTPGLLAETLQEVVPEVEFAATTTWINPETLSVGEKSLKAEGFSVGQHFFQIFSYPLAEGDPALVLKDKYAIVITRDLARRLFGTDQNVVGKTIEYQHAKTFHVTGLFDKVRNSSWQFDFVLNFEEFKMDNKWVLEWGNNGPATYVRLREGSDAAALSDKIKDFVLKRNEGSNVTLFLQRYSERYLHGRWEDGKQTGGRIEYVILFSIIAGFILLIACINFMNLSTARASKKAKEVGIRKSIGAQRQSLIFQYLSESLATSLVSLALAVALVWAVLPQFNLITDKQITFDVLTPSTVGIMLLLGICTGLLAGSYPAIFLSGFMPAQVLKGVVRGSWSELWARRGLVVFQFCLSVILIVAVMVIYRQVDYVQTQNLGYDKEHLIHFGIEGKISSTRETFLNEIRKLPGVVSASSISQTFLGRNNNTSGLAWEGKNESDEILFENIGVNHGALETMGIQMAEGRGFSEDSPSDTTKIIFNEAAIKVMGLQNPIGKTIKLWGKYDLEIIGVAKDFHFQSLHDVINPLFFRLSPANTWSIVVRLEAGKEKETLQALNTLYTTYNPGFTFDYKFQDQEYAHLYAAEQRVASLSGYFALFAILISCLGLFGLAAFTAERRLKEIGIRKALGSSSLRIVLLLSGDFTRMVLLSILIGLPISYYLLDSWLQKFAFHIDLTIWYFIGAGAVALLIAWITVASQAIRASRVNPVECLHQE
ncbi:MAG TPA: ABC transporter permease [Cyclobacteriaceae bacterium]|nr:ABC transporter permease [Cyclobacteriaceae bacterium]